MRISDWSSDVCSSDLGEPEHVLELADVLADDRGRHAQIACRLGEATAFSHAHKRVELVQIPDRRHASHPKLLSADRKSVVLGKRGTVRVDLGGGRVIKKQKAAEKQCTRKQQKQ